MTLGVKKRFDNLTVSGDITYSLAKEDVPFIKSAQFRTGNLDYNGEDGDPPPFQYEFAGFYPQFNNQGAYQPLTDADEYPLRRFRVEDSLREETIWTPSTWTSPGIMMNSAATRAPSRSAPSTPPEPASSTTIRSDRSARTVSATPWRT